MGGGDKFTCKIPRLTSFTTHGTPCIIHTRKCVYVCAYICIRSRSEGTRTSCAPTVPAKSISSSRDTSGLLLLTEIRWNTDTTPSPSAVRDDSGVYYEVSLDPDELYAIPGCFSRFICFRSTESTSWTVQ